jgi:hypothetical protein
MTVFYAVVTALVIGAALGYAFRGYISREKTAAASAVIADAGKAISKL